MRLCLKNKKVRKIFKLIKEQRKKEETRMDVKVDIVDNFFYIPTSDLKSAMVATGDINVELHRKNTPVNWKNDLSMRKEIKILSQALTESEKKKNKKEKKNQIKMLKAGKDPIKKNDKKGEKKENKKPLVYEVIWLSELESEKRKQILSKMSDEEKLLRMKQFEVHLKNMELDLGLRNFEIYLTDFQKIMEDNSKFYKKRLALVNKNDEDEDIMEIKTSKPKKRKQEKDKSKQNKRNLLLPWTFELSFIEYGGYNEMEDTDVEKFRYQNLKTKKLEFENKSKNSKKTKETKSKPKKIEELDEETIIEKIEGEGQVKFPIIRMKKGEKKLKAMMHNDKVIIGKLNQLVFDISLKDIQLLQKIYTFHFGIFSQHKEGKPETENIENKEKKEEKTNQKEIESLTANIISNSSIKFIVEKPVRISLVNDFENVFVRSLVIQMSKLEINGDIERESKFFIGFQLKIMYYNSGLTSWEPVLEKLNMMIEYSQYEESIQKQINDMLEEKMIEYDEERLNEMNKLKKKGKLTQELAMNFQTGRAQTIEKWEKEEVSACKLSVKKRTMIKIEQGIKMREFEGEEGVRVQNNETEVMNFNVTIAFLEKVIFFQKVFQEINEERAQLQKNMNMKMTKLLEVKDFDASKTRKTEKKKKGEGIVSPARVVNQTGYPIEVEYQKKQVKITEGNMNIEIKNRKLFKIPNTDSFPLFWDNFEIDSLFEKNNLNEKTGQNSTQMDTFFYKTLSFKVRHPKFGMNWIKNLSLNDNFDRKMVTKGKQRILSDFRVLCNSRNIGDLKEITISSQVLIENQLTARGCRRIINIETVHPFGRSIITVKPGQKKFIPFDLINFETRIYANKDRMIPQNFKFNNFILKERNYKMIFHSKNYSYNFILKVERDPKFFYLTRLVAVPAISFKNDMPYPCDLFLSNGVQQEVITLKQGEFVKKCNFNILNSVTFMTGIIRPEVLEEEEKSGVRDTKKIIKIIKEDPYQRYYFKSKGKLILQNGHLGEDYKKILSLYNNKEQRTYFSIVRWITPDSYFGFLLYSDSAIVNETPYRLHFRGTDPSRNNQVDPIPQMESGDLKAIPESQISFMSSKRSTLEIQLRNEEKNKMLFFSTKFSNKIATSGFVNGVFIINMQKQKDNWVQSERHIPKIKKQSGNITQSMMPLNMKPGLNSEKTIESSKIEESNLLETIREKGNDETFNEMFPSSKKITTNKMYLEIGYKISLVYSQENKGALATKVIHLCPKTIISNETEYLLVVKQTKSENISLDPHSKKPIYAFVGENGKNKLFKISLIEKEQVFQSSVEVDFNKGGSISLIMMSKNKKHWKIVRVEMLIEDSYMFVKVSDRTGKKDMIIKNNIDYPIRIFQAKHNQVFRQVLNPGEIKEMAWVDPYKDQKIKAEILKSLKPNNVQSERVMDIKENKFEGSFSKSSMRLPKPKKSHKKLSNLRIVNNINLDDFLYKVIDEMEIEIQNLKKAEIKTKQNKRLTVDIKLVHHSRMIEIETESKHKEEKKLLEIQEKSSGTNVMTCLIKIAKMGVSLVAKTNRVRRELFYLYVNETNLFYEKEGPNTSIQFQVRYLNIDNNYSSQCRFPVLFTCGRSLNEMTLKNQYMVNCILKMIEVESSPELEGEENSEQKITCFDEITLELSPLTMTFEWSIISIMSEFSEQLSEIVSTSKVDRTYLSKYFLSEEQLSKELNPAFDLNAEWEGKNIESSVWIYCNRLNISCLKFVVTFNMNKDESGELSKSEDSYLNVVVNTLGGTLLNIDESPLKFKGIELFYVFESSNGLISLYKQHLLDQAKLNVMRLLGSFDILGNPTNLFGNVGDGVVQFFEKPVEGFKKGPISGIKGIASGSTALLKNTAAGTLNAISKFTGSLASGLTILSNDKTYQRQRNLKKAKKPKGVLEGLESGAQSIGKGVWSGVTGIVTQPIKEIKKSGAIGIFKGIFKGITGVITKPLGGILDATSQTTEGIKKTITKNDDKANEFKQRPPRVFYTDKNIIKVYDNEHAKRIKALVKVDSNLENESLIDSVQLSLQFKKKKKKCILVITNNYFVILNENLSKIHITCEIMDVKKVEFKLGLDVNGKFLFFFNFKENLWIMEKFQLIIW